MVAPLDAGADEPLELALLPDALGLPDEPDEPDEPLEPLEPDDGTDEVAFCASCAGALVTRCSTLPADGLELPEDVPELPELTGADGAALLGSRATFVAELSPLPAEPDGDEVVPADEPLEPEYPLEPDDPLEADVPLGAALVTGFVAAVTGCCVPAAGELLAVGAVDPVAGWLVVAPVPELGAPLYVGWVVAGACSVDPFDAEVVWAEPDEPDEPDEAPLDSRCALPGASPV